MVSKIADAPSGFLTLFPLPQRCILLIIVGMWLWLWQITIMHRFFHIDVSQLVLSHDPHEALPQQSATRQTEATRRVVSRLTKIILPWCAATSVLLSECTKIQAYSPPVWAVCLLNIQSLCQFIFIFATICSYSPMVSRCLRKIMPLGNIEAKPLRLNYILITDSLTSYSKPLIDFGFYLCHLVLDPLNEACIISRSPIGTAINLDLAIGSTPVLLRLLQCLREWRRSKYAKDARSSLFNALKYSLHIPIVLCTVYSRSYPTAKPGNHIYWLMLVNSSYSLWWDLTMDWELGIFDFSIHGMNRNEVLRRRKVFPNYMYYFAMCADFALRFVWLWELLAGRSVFEGEANIFFLQSLEILRRWIWIFIKLEAEAINSDLPEKNYNIE
ncbi:Erd1p [Lachancea thermotolerans CBS 6340]|uniref:KLTH0G03366p n=1 Tax=Lachancea thermotolerans (strain ATCC 56472 / CBS 6340 / NRRL Y-8284) TaxID=559295 RepID=C5DLT7_LACTC|nr:KLTH0G03366p [Lachancea thermotolerans CBS 6340]CAR24748.1 KLTH0G03366p [Lachancea thermotolerans CBS 6340]